MEHPDIITTNAEELAEANDVFDDLYERVPDDYIQVSVQMENK